MARKRHDFDSPWKETVEKFLRSFLGLCFPEVEAAVDWTRPVAFLDKELQAVRPEAQSRRQYVDKLVQVTQRGVDTWLLIHVEVQTQPDAELPARMYRYFNRLHEVHRQPLESLAVLADDDPKFRPGPYRLGADRTRVVFEYPRCKLLDFSEERLARLGDPVARIVRAHRAAQRTKRDPEGRLREKWDLLSTLQESGLAPAELREVARLSEWLLPLPPAQDIQFERQITEFERKKVMPYVTCFERYALKRGLQRGLRQGRSEGRQEGRHQGRSEGEAEGLRRAVFEVLQSRWGTVLPEAARRLEVTQDPNQLSHWLRLAVRSPSVEAFLTALPAVPIISSATTDPGPTTR